MTTRFQIFRSIEDTERYSAGETIFSVGDPAENMYVVRDGEVEILVQEHPFFAARVMQVVAERLRRKG